MSDRAVMICTACGRRAYRYLDGGGVCLTCGGRSVFVLEWPEDSDAKSLAAHYLALAESTDREISELREALRDAEALARRWFTKSAHSGVSDATAIRAEEMADMRATLAALSQEVKAQTDRAMRSMMRAACREVEAQRLRSYNKHLIERIGPDAEPCLRCGNPMFACTCED